jgi:transcriptional regulator with XRE-family HTH domain
VPKTTINVQQALGLRIRELRAERGITQEELAEHSGVFRTYMSRVEAGKANPTLTMLHMFANALEITIQELLEWPTVTTVPKVRSKEKLSRGRVSKS